MITDKKLGKLPAKSSEKALMFANYLPKKAIKLPSATNFWKERAPIPIRMFANDVYGDCTRASQAIAALRMERIETRKTIEIADSEVVRVYFEMTKKYYGGGDTGAYEEDALSEWRKPDCTFRDSLGRPLTIDAFTRINQANLTEVKTAIFTSGAHGVKMCFNLPAAFATQTQVWDIPKGQPLMDDYLPGSWGGHSVYVEDYDAFGVWVPTWDLKIHISWAAVSAYADESHVIIDSINSWKKKKFAKQLDLGALRADVNAVSSFKIK